jgi:hypothetical protein
MADSTDKGRVVLKDGYYLDNFRILLDFVYERYKELLNKNERGFIHDFKTLSVDAQRLYVRLISRKGPYFREDKLNYTDIASMNYAVAELCEKGFFAKNPELGIEFVLDTLTKPELDEFLKVHSSALQTDTPKFARRADLIDLFLNLDENLLLDHLYRKYTLLYPLFIEHITLFKLLFFGNVYQDLSEFILQDLGLLKFETYEIRKEDRYFSERKVVDDTLLISRIRTELFIAVQTNDLDTVLTVGEFLKAYAFHEKVKTKLEKSFTEIGRFIEKFQLWNLALSYYDLSRFPPAAERKIRVLDKQGEHQKALDLCLLLQQSTENEEEKEFAATFSEGLKKKMQLPFQKKALDKYTTEVMEADIDKTIRIEELVLNRYVQNGYLGFYSENGIWKALFALLFWDVIFMPLPEVFFNPFQRGPVDLFSSEFRSKRNDAFEQRMEELRQGNLSEIVSDRYKFKFTTANALMSWKYIGLDQLALITETVAKAQLLVVLDRMSYNLKDLKTGFPDLIVFDPGERSYCMVEVKGPGDQLRPNQKRWLRFFEQYGIPYKVVYVKQNLFLE